MESSTLKMEELASKLTYTKEEVKDIASKVIFKEKNIASERYFLENEYEIRKNSYNKMLSEVESNLDSDEEIFVSKINIPDRDGTAGLSICVYYQGLFFTNKRVFIFYMNFRYEEIEKSEFYSLQDIDFLKERDDLNGVRVQFKNTKSIFIKSYSKTENELTLIIVKHLLDNGISFSTKSTLLNRLFG